MTLLSRDDAVRGCAGCISHHARLALAPPSRQRDAGNYAIDADDKNADFSERYYFQ